MITIIILLILAVVSIRLVINNGILGKAESGVSKYQEAEADEQAQLLKAEYEMAKYEGKFSGTYTDYVLETKYNGVKIGDYVSYNEAGFGDYTTDTSKGIGGSVGTQDSTTGKYPLTEKTYTTENLGWRVLGVNDKGELELISDNPTTDVVALANEEGYLYGPEELNKMCNTLYGNGTGSTGKVVATGARSLKGEDINTLGNYDPTTYSGYGVEWTYRYPTTEEVSGTRYMQSSKDGGITWNNITNSSSQTFRMPGADSSTTISSSNPGSERLTYTFYAYKISNYVKQIASDGTSMAEILYNGTSNITQWLASRAVQCRGGAVGFDVINIYYGGCVTSSFDLYNSLGISPNSGEFHVRPVVSLKSDIQIEKTETNDGSTLEKACIIK